MIVMVTVSPPLEVEVSSLTELKDEISADGDFAKQHLESPALSHFRNHDFLRAGTDCDEQGRPSGIFPRGVYVSGDLGEALAKLPHPVSASRRRTLL